MTPASLPTYEDADRRSLPAANLEGVKGPSGPLELHSFSTPESMERARTMSDADMGGFSEVNLDWIPPKPQTEKSDYLPPSENRNGHARFHGTISTQLPRNRPDVERSGYAAWKTLDRPPTIFGKALWDIDMYNYLALRVKSDGRSYLVNVQTESIVPTDLHQHRLFSKRPGEWETILIRWNDFVRTNHGFVVEPQTEMLRQKVRTIGIGLTDRIQGPFDLSIEKIWATNNAREADHDHVETEATKSGLLKSKDGKNIAWAESPR